MNNQINWPEIQNESEDTISETRSNKTKTWIYRIVCILLFTAGIAYYMCLLIKSQYIITLNYPFLRNTAILNLSIIAAMVIILVCFLRTFMRIPLFRFAALIIAGAVLVANWYIYFRYFPKYGQLDACAIVKSGPKYASATIEPHYRFYCGVEDNPFCDTGYILNVIEHGKVTLWIMFDSTTGRYDFCEPDY